jgi:hypothetical protein
MRVKRLHQITGLLVVIIFLLTGQYMDLYYRHMEGVDDGMRMMFRSRHIYLLLAGLLNIGIGSYFSYRAEQWRKALQLAGSVLVLVAPFVLLLAFFREPTLANLQRPFTLPAIVALLTGTLLHLLSGLRQKSELAARSIE